MVFKKLCLIILSAVVFTLSLVGAARASGFSLVMSYNHHPSQIYISPYVAKDSLSFVYSDGNLYRSTNSGRSWTELGFQQFNDLAFLSEGVVLASGTPYTNGKLSLYSNENGSDVWTPIVPSYENASLPIIMEPAGDLLLGNFSEMIESSADGGKTWANIPTYGVIPEQGCLSAIDENKYIAVMEDCSVQTTDDGGESWVDTSIRLGTAPIPNTYIENGGTCLYGKVAAVPGFAVAFCPDAPASVYISRDDGGTWTKVKDSSFVVSKGSQPETAYCVAVAPGGLAFVGTPHGVLISGDYGTTWKLATGNILGEVTDIACSPAGKKVIVLASAKGLYRMEYDMPAAPAPAPKSTVIKFVLGQDKYSVNGKVYAVNAAAFMEGNRTLVPVRYLGDALGAKTTWDKATKTVTLTKSKTVVKFAIGSSKIVVNGKTSAIDAPPVIKNGRIYLPARYVAGAFGFKVSWDDKSKTVILK